MLDAVLFITGATLSAMLGLMQLRVDRTRGGVSGYLRLWALGFVWTFGNFLRCALDLGGVGPDTASARFAESFAWSCTLLGPIAIGRLLQGGIGTTSPLSRRFFSFTVGMSLINVVLMAYANRAYDFHLDESWYPETSFFLGLGIGATALAIYLGQRKQPTAMPRWFGPAAVLSTAIPTSAILFSALFPDMPAGLQTAARLIGSHWTIPWSVLLAASLAQAHYADVVAKRSLWLLVSVSIATLVGLQVLQMPPGLPQLGTVLLIAVLMLAAPVLIRALDALVDSVILDRADYSQATSALDQAFRSATSQDQLIDAALASVRATLRVDARYDELVATPLQINTIHHARRLLQPEIAFLDSVRAQLAHRLDSLRFEDEQRALHLREERLKRLLTEAELKALRTQVDPHFLFNTLNTIADLIGSNPTQAERMTVRLAECFRYALAKHSRDLSTLDEELDFAGHYLGIEQVRFGERLRVQLSRGDALGSEPVPSLLLQPLLENAVRHGLAPLREGGTLSVSARREGERLRMSIEDDGVGIREAGASAGEERTGVGLRNVQERLRTLYGQAAEFLIGTRTGGGTAVTIVIPLHAD
jgi:hypothetical protein